VFTIILGKGDFMISKSVLEELLSPMKRLDRLPMNAVAVARSKCRPETATNPFGAFASVKSG
jgi:hypothetical protein